MKPRDETLTAEQLRELLEYRAGELVWLVPRTNNKVKIGDVAGSLHRDGYVYISINRRLYLRSRLVWLWHHGSWPTNCIDHINRVTDDDRIENLRDVTNQQNRFNTGARGYYWHKPTQKWLARIRVNGKSIHIGYYDTKEEARAAYLAAKAIYHVIDSPVRALAI